MTPALASWKQPWYLHAPVLGSVCLVVTVLASAFLFVTSTTISLANVVVLVGSTLSIALMRLWQVESRVHRAAEEKARAQLTESREQFHALVNAMPHMVWQSDRSGAATYFNDQCYRVTGAQRGDAGGIDFRSYLHPDDTERVYETWDRAVKAGHVFQSEHRIRSAPDGEYRWFLARGVPVCGESGQFVRWYGSATDIHELKLSKEKIAEQAASLESIIDNVLDGIFSIDAAGKILSWNRAAMKIFGYRESEAVGNNVSMLLPDVQDGPDIARLAQLSNWRQIGESGAARALIARRKDGSEVPIELAVSESMTCGEVILIGVARDVTERKWAEGEASARRAADAANRAKSQFLAAMSHEIRTPMNGIVGMTELTLGTSLTDQQRQYLSLVKTSAISLLNLINDVLDFSKVEEGKLDLDPQPFEIRKVLTDIAKSLAVGAHSRGLELILHIEDSVPRTVVADSGRIGQVLVNLIGNAVKFTPAGEIELRVSAAPADRDADFALITLSVRDTGIGISTERLADIFDPFVQAEVETTRKYGGTGLGLSICKKIAEIMQGTIEVQSLPGKGSIFSFSVPMKKIQERVYRVQTLLGLRALVVDDNHAAAVATVGMLIGLGASAEYALDAETALAAAERASLDHDPFGVFLIDTTWGADAELTAPHIGLSRRLARTTAGAGPIVMMTPMRLGA